ncbi:MAG: L,D-transpeptidase family protein [Planctomycetes bacterium]|nr:L,D-transpeptidase family protein [Planctomycetota bacterium]
MKKSAFFVSVLVVGGTFLVVWHLRSSSNASVPALPASTSVPERVSPEPKTVSIPPPRPVPSGTSEADRLLKQGLVMLKRGDKDGAKKVFIDLMKRFPSRPAGARAAVRLGDIQRKAGDLFEARNAFSAALGGLPEGPEREAVVRELNVLNGELVFSKKEAPDSISYLVKSSDVLSRIAARYHLTVGFIKRINYLTSDLIHVGDHLKVFQGPFDIVIEKSKFRLTVHRSEVFIKEYRIGIGENGSTPEGEFVVKNKLVNPVWNPPGFEYAASGAADNPLGTRWIGFADHYGIHGTVEPDTIGKESSRGCIRLLNKEAEELYDLVVLGSKVVIKP